jgi:hypothetical protein
MEQNLIIIPSAGLAIPADRVDYYRWQAQSRQTYRVEISNDDSNKFRLNQRQMIVFYHEVFRLNDPKPILLDQQEYTTAHSVEPFMQSALYTGLSSRSTERITHVLQRIIREQKKISQATSEADRLRELVGNNPENNLELDKLENFRNRRTRRLSHWLNELTQFTEAKSTDLTERLNIDEMRNSEWWTHDANNFFEALLEESYTDKFTNVKSPKKFDEANTTAVNE